MSRNRKRGEWEGKEHARREKKRKIDRKAEQRESWVGRESNWHTEGTTNTREVILDIV